MRISELRHSHPQAYADLPEPYQADDCLVFFIDGDGNLRCCPDENQVHILGDWEAVYNPTEGSWTL